MHQKGYFVEEATSVTFSSRVGSENRKRGQQTHTGRIHSRDQIPNMDRKHHASQEGKWATSDLRGLSGSQ